MYIQLLCGTLVLSGNYLLSQSCWSQGFYSVSFCSQQTLAESGCDLSNCVCDMDLGARPSSETAILELSHIAVSKVYTVCCRGKSKHFVKKKKSMHTRAHTQL